MLRRARRMSRSASAAAGSFWTYATIALHGDEEMSPDHAARFIQTLYRRRASEEKVRLRLSGLDRPVKIVLLRASGLRAADENGLSDPFVIVSVVDQIGGAKIADYSKSYQLAMFKSKPVYQTLNPTFNQSLLLPHTHGSVEIFLTMIDLDRFSKDDFLGQAKICMSDSFKQPCKPDASPAGDVTLPLGPLQYRPRDRKNVLVKMADKQLTGQGLIELRLEMWPSYQTQCGYLLWREGGAQKKWANRWCVLTPEGFFIYKDPHDCIPSTSVSMTSITCLSLNSPGAEGQDCEVELCFSSATAKTTATTAGAPAMIARSSSSDSGGTPAAPDNTDESAAAGAGATPTGPTGPILRHQFRVNTGIGDDSLHGKTRHMWSWKLVTGAKRANPGVILEGRLSIEVAKSLSQPVLSPKKRKK